MEQLRIDISDVENELGHLKQTVSFGDRFDIFMSTRRPDLQSPGVLAVEAQSKHGGITRYYALICQKKYPPRQDIMRLATRMTRLGTVTPVDAGVILFPEDGVYRYVIVFEIPKGFRPLTPNHPGIPKLKDEEIIFGFVSRISNFLREASSRAIAHRAIRADNIFIDREMGSVTLGEFVSTPAGLFQPALYETIELSQCSPLGKGPGTHSDDLYSFGVVIAQLAMGGTKCDRMDEESIIEEKIRRGSYVALVEQEAVPLRLVEPLHGLLNDNPADRWSLEDIDYWMSGRRQRPKMGGLAPRAIRAFKFQGKEYWTARGLAYGFSRNWREAKQVVSEKEELDTWIRRALLNEDMANRVRDTINGSSVYSGAGDAMDRGLSTVLMAMDSNAPIHYRGMSLRFNAVTDALGLAVSAGDGEATRNIREILRLKLPHHWLGTKKAIDLTAVPILNSLDGLERRLAKNLPGQGIHSAIYDGCDGLPCLSPLLGKHYCADLASLLAILNQLARAGKLEGVPYDDHILAFVSKNLEGSHEKTLKSMQSDDPITVVRSYLRLLGHAQSSHEGMYHPHLTVYLCNLLRDSVENFKNVYFRNEVYKALDIVTAKGDLDNLGYLLDNRKMEEQDATGFSTAQQVYNGLHAQIRWLHDGGLQTSQQFKHMAGRVAATMSAVLSMIALMLIILNRVL